MNPDLVGKCRREHNKANANPLLSEKNKEYKDVYVHIVVGEKECQAIKKSSL